MGAKMAKPSERRRPFSLEVGFEVGRGGRDALGRAYERLGRAYERLGRAYERLGRAYERLGRAYERLVPLLARSLPPSPPATLAKGAHHESPASQSGLSLRGSAGGHLRSCLVRSAG